MLKTPSGQFSISASRRGNVYSRENGDTIRQGNGRPPINAESTGRKVIKGEVRGWSATDTQGTS